MPVPVISVAQMREWEQATWDAGVKEADVIRQVGRSLQAWLMDRVAWSVDELLIVAGKGNNGEDARQCAPVFEEFGMEPPKIVNVKDPAADLPALEQALSGARKRGVIDALFGIGLNRPLNDDWIRVIECINESATAIFSVDCPSGLHADTGAPMGAAIRATRTLTLGAPKRGLLAAQASEYVGGLDLESCIGLVAHPLESGLQWVIPQDFQGYPPVRSVASHKGAQGHVAVIAGSVGYHGAAVLAAEGALSAQPGLTTVLTHEGCYEPVAAQLKAAMVHPWSRTPKLPEKCTAALIGPGLASEDLPGSLREFARSLWRESDVPVIADASVLDWLPEGATSDGQLRVITPHPGEAARMLRTTAKAVQADRRGALLELSARFGGCWVVLKGHQTLIGREHGEVSVNSTGNPLLAQGGSGDVLAGFIAGLLAQPALAKDAGKALRYGVWAHGHVADRAAWSGTGLAISELPGLLRRQGGEEELAGDPGG